MPETQSRDPHHNSQREFEVSESRDVAVRADLTIEVDGQSLSVRGDGDAITIEIPSWTTGLAILRNTSARSRVARLSRLLQRAGLIATVQTPRRRLLTIGHRKGSWLLLHLVGLPHSRIHVLWPAAPGSP